MAEAAELLSQGGIQDALVAGELYVSLPDGRPRVHDVTSVARQPSTLQDLENLRFAAFDIISLDGKLPGEQFADTWKQLLVALW